MPIKEKDKALIKVRNYSYANLKEFLEDMFYRDKEAKLAEYAHDVLRLIYDRKELGLQAKNWKEYIEDIFNVEQLTDEESEKLKQFTKEGKKPYQTILKQADQGEITITAEQKSLLQKAVKWSSSVSAYYSIVNKLVAIGLVEKRQGRYYKSTKILDRFKSVEKAITDFEVLIRS